MVNNQKFAYQTGVTLLEVLVTLIILAIGLLGLAGLQMRLQSSQMEAFQRSQALIMLNDMASRIAANRTNAASYVTGTTNPLGTGATCPSGSSSNAVQNDKHEWCLALQGAGEKVSTTNAGGPVAARGCVEQPDTGVKEFIVTIAWQGLTPLTAPSSGLACGQNSYDIGTNCVDDLCRRTVSTVVRVSTLN
ncbi:type IV pilus modification protein PilV [Leeia oryzae]|uniref:type IV pilus modification protein PilV n=1 Tax=Leeia oryzae TaxID=356662 RepID=UPI0003809448|nr:type IV pilus modification protein PilV [Leeia oryzae]